MKKLLVFLPLVLISIINIAQIGKHGILTITTANRVVNEYTTLNANANAGATSLNVVSNSLNANGRFSGSLEAGDLIMIIQMSGVTMNANSHPDPAFSEFSFPVDASWGNITNYNNCGNYEFAEVYSVSGTNIINLDCGLKNNYTASGKVQIIRVPRYTILIVNTSASLTCDIWNGSTGGIVVVEAKTNVNVRTGGGIHANTRGYRGGLALLNTSDLGGGQYGHSSYNQGAEKGEGIYGYQLEYSNVSGRYCRGAGANAGGGGDSHNAGGGGGGNGGNPAAWTGQGNPDISGPNWATAWNLEGPGFAASSSSGGGRGGYSFSSTNQNALTVGPGDPTWTGDDRRQVGGLGGRPLDYSTGKIFMGGGAGSQNNDFGGDGGRGGGIVYILGYGNVTGAGVISANGDLGENSQGAAPSTGWAGVDGAGGGGAGGTVIINTVSSVGGVSITANGANGGNQVKTYGLLVTPGNNTEAEGPGGGGGGGYIAISSGTPSRTASGGANGTTNSSGLTEFIPNGATRGGIGTDNASITPTTLTVSNVNACYGDDINITAILGGSVPTGTQVVWWDAATAGNTIHTGNTYTINNATTSTTLWVGFCPGWYRKEVTVTVTGSQCVASNDATICNGNTVQLNASGGVTYSWSPAGSLNNPNISNPIASPTTTTLYYVTASEGVCQSVDSVLITVNTVNATVTPNTAICAGNTIQLNASGGTSYSWNNGSSLSASNISNPVASPATTTTYTVTVSDGIGCFDIKTVTVTVNPNPVVNLGPDTTFCSGNTLVLNPGAGYSNYNWNPAGSNPTYNVTTSGTYFVTVTDANTCQGTDQIAVTVLPQMDATITSGTDYCNNGPTVLFTATNGGGTWTGPGISGTGTFDPSGAGSGAHEIIYTITGLCGDVDTLNINVHTAPVVNLGVDTTICSGTSLLLNAGSGYSSYNWNPAGSNPTYNVTTSGTYSVTVTDAHTCKGTDQIAVTVVTQMDATITSGTDYCSNGAPVSFTATDGGGIWTGPGISSGGTFDPSTAGAGVHEIIYTIASACGDADTVQVQVHAAPEPNLGSITQLCEGTTFTLDAGAGYSNYNWSPSGSTQTITITTAGTYSVTVTDPNGCTGNTSITMTEEPWADATITPAGPWCDNDPVQTLEAAENGGVWSGNGVSSSGIFTPSLAGAGMHEIIYTIPGLCGDTDTTNIYVNPSPLLSLISTPETCAGKGDAQIELIIDGAYPPYIILWNNGETGNLLLNLSPGTYLIEVTDSNNCKKTAQETIIMATNECFTSHVYIPNIFSPNSDGQNDVLYVRGDGIQQLELIIYNRWGEIVFKSTDQAKGWDGTYKGAKVEAGAYSYILKAEFSGNVTKKLNGTITVVY